LVDDLARQANLLGAFGQAITDRVAAGTADAALSALHHFLDGPTLDQLRQVLGLTPSGAVRLVDRLAAAGLVTRGPGADGRSRSVVLTPAGRAAAERVSAARAETLAGLLGELSPAERETLHGLLGRLMAGVVRGKDGGAWLCRMCDIKACGRTEGHCPTANAAAVKYGTA
jgi:DNA-binding MarR family transcriptional regulator